jgi:hypothetical protein
VGHRGKGLPPRVEHALLGPWCEREGKGAIQELAAAGGVTWAAARSIVRHGAVPKYDTAKGIADRTGFSVDAIITESKRCREEIRVLTAPTNEAA